MKIPACTLSLCLFVTGAARAQEPPPAQASQQQATAQQELALKLANPLASMISVPFQFNVLLGVGQHNGSQLVTNFQPVIPFAVGKVSIITRTIVPFIENRNVFSPASTTFGLSDVNFSAFLTPVKPGRILWGIGPAVAFPTATASRLGAEKWAAGPTLAIMKQVKGWTYILLARQMWSFAGHQDVEDVSPYFVNPGIGYSFASGAGLGANVEVSGNWTDSSNTQAFLNFSASMVSKFGNQLVSFSLGPRLPLTSGTLGDWGLRTGFTLIFKQ
jgi:hypothetical protein